MTSVATPDPISTLKLLTMRQDKSLSPPEYFGRLGHDVIMNGAIAFFLATTMAVFGPIALSYFKMMYIALAVMAITGVVHVGTQEIDWAADKAAAAVSTVKDAVATGKIEKLEVDGAALVEEMRAAGLFEPEQRPAWLQELSDAVKEAGLLSDADIFS